MAMTSAFAVDPLVGSNSLADLAARIRHEHCAAAEKLTEALRHAMTAGELLVEAKALVQHGQWLRGSPIMSRSPSAPPALHAPGEEPGGDRGDQKRNGYCGFDPERGGGAPDARLEHLIFVMD